MDDVLARIDEALDDYVTWHGSVDSATWSPDGSHQETAGQPYTRPQIHILGGRRTGQHEMRRDPAQVFSRPLIRASARCGPSDDVASGRRALGSTGGGGE